MKVTYVYLGVIAILLWNSFAIHRDNVMFSGGATSGTVHNASW
jgi:hypothetical protein